MTGFWLVNWVFIRPSIHHDQESRSKLSLNALKLKCWMDSFVQVLRSADSYRYHLLLIWFWTWAKFWQHEILLKYSYFAQCWVKCSYSKLIFLLDFMTYERYVLRISNQTKHRKFLKSAFDRKLKKNILTVEYLERLEGKIRKSLFFYVKIF